MDPFKYLNDKVVLITGGSMGIGKELARQAVEAGAKVIITGRSEQRLRSVTEEFAGMNENLVVHRGDAASYDDNLKLVGEIIARFGRLDIVISNAGISAYGDLEETHEKVVDELIGTNLKGSVFIYKAAIPELRKTKGSILFISSTAAFRGLPYYSLYSATKMALTSLVQSLRIENRGKGVFIGISYLGFTENEPEKRTISPEGIPEEVPARNKRLITSRNVTARKLLKQIKNRKPVVIHSRTGKLNYFLSRYLPFIVILIHRKIYRFAKGSGDHSV